MNKNFLYLAMMFFTALLACKSKPAKEDQSLLVLEKYQDSINQVRQIEYEQEVRLKLRSLQVFLNMTYGETCLIDDTTFQLSNLDTLQFYDRQYFQEPRNYSFSFSSRGIRVNEIIVRSYLGDSLLLETKPKFSKLEFQDEYASSQENVALLQLLIQLAGTQIVDTFNIFIQPNQKFDLNLSQSAMKKLFEIDRYIQQIESDQTLTLGTGRDALSKRENLFNKERKMVKHTYAELDSEPGKQDFSIVINYFKDDQLVHSNIKLTSRGSEVKLHQKLYFYRGRLILNQIKGTDAGDPIEEYENAMKYYRYVMGEEIY